MHALFRSFMSLKPMGAFLSLFFYHHILPCCLLHLFFSLFYLLLVLLPLFSTLSGDHPQFITERMVASFPLSIPWTLIRRPLVWEGHLIGESLWYFSTWEHIHPLLILSLWGSFIYVKGMCIYIYVTKKKWKRKKMKEKKNRLMCVCA